VYDVLEEYSTCGVTFFPVKEISEQLAKKGKRRPKLDQYGEPMASPAHSRGRKAAKQDNDYNREYTVVFTNHTFARVQLTPFYTLHILTILFSPQLITNQTPRFTIGDCAAGHRADNRDKNRNVLIVPRKLHH